MNNQKLFVRPVILLISLVLTFIVSCQLEAPLKEMVNARLAIDSAKEVDAEKYSPDELKNSELLLLKSHDLLTEKKEADAKKSAEDSLAAANEAEKKALPLFADAHMKAATDEYNDADKVYAEKFSHEKFVKAGELNQSAKTSYDAGEYRKAAKTADEAFAVASEAKNESMSNSSSIESQIKALESKIASLKKDRFSKEAEANLSRASASTTNARKELGSKNFRSALDEIKAAETEINSAAVTIKKKALTSSIEKLRKDIDTNKRATTSSEAKEDLDRAMLALNSAESSVEQNNLEDAALKVKEAESLISGADIKQKEKNALAALDRAEDLLKKATEKDADKKHTDNLKKADSLITGGRKSVKDRKFNEAINNAEEAESIIAAVTNAIETEINEMKLKVAAEEEAKKTEAARLEKERLEKEQLEKERLEKEAREKAEKEAAREPEKEEIKKPEGKIYTVQWRKKNTDCLWRIAQKVYKDAAFWPAIYIANRDQIKDPDLIFPGQKFLIPPKPEKRPSYKKIMEEEKKTKAEGKETTETK